MTINATPAKSAADAARKASKSKSLVAIQIAGVHYVAKKADVEACERNGARFPKFFEIVKTDGTGTMTVCVPV